jgi:2-polyprenyl-3-methyl-5-hydroxy-6-metoxy-1,4-benzoquinol methylase
MRLKTKSEPRPLPAALPACRFCGSPLSRLFVDLGAQPPSNAYLDQAALGRMEATFPLKAHVCERCFLVQLEAFQTPDEIFGHYAYFSSFSQSWLDHARHYANQAIKRFDLGAASQVVEVASNDGYLLQYFRAAGIPVLGVEPAENVASVARGRGIATVSLFFGRETARQLVREGRQADLLIGNNVFAHVPDLNDFTAGLAIALKPTGTLTLEFPHLLRLIEDCQFDTIYHEHFSYFSLTTAEKVLAAHDLIVTDVEELATHGGSLRLYAQHRGSGAPSAAVTTLRQREAKAGIIDISAYRGFAERTAKVKRELLRFLIDAKESGKRVVAYGAAAKGNTLLNYCGVRGDLIDYVVDLSPHKQGRYLPGSRLPILAPEALKETRPDYVLILPWNLAPEIETSMGHIREWGGRFVTAIPRLAVRP